MATGVATVILLLFLLWSPWDSAAGAPEVCQKEDCYTYDSPASKDRVCRMHNMGLFGNTVASQLEWYTGTLDSPRCTRDSRSRNFLELYCPGYVGMHMSLLCEFTNVTSVIYKDGMPLSDGPTVTFNQLQKENEGLYQCRRRGSLQVIAEFNMTVQSEIHIGGADSKECVLFFCRASPVTERKCCYYRVTRYPEFHSDSNKLMYLSVYGDSPMNISLAVEWVTNSTAHYPTDLGAYIERTPTNPIGWEINFRHYPDNVNKDELQAVIVITATNNISSALTCIRVTFEGTNVYSANTSLPQGTNTTVGGNATFICEFGSNQPDETLTPLLSFEISLPDEDGNSTTFSTDCEHWNTCGNWSPDLLTTTQLSIRSINTFSESAFIRYRYEVNLINVVQEFNASQFSCSISTVSGRSEHILQWKGTAELIVEPSLVVSSPPSSMVPVDNVTMVPVDNVTMPGVSAPSRSMGPIIAAAVILVIIFALVVVVSLLLVTFLKWRRKPGVESYELSQVPSTILPNSSIVPQSTTTNPPGEQCHTTATTTTTTITTASTESYGLPAISIMDVGRAQRNIVVGREMLHETRSTDSGVSCTEDYEHNTQQRRPPNTLGMTRAQQLKILESSTTVRLCRSETDIADSPPDVEGAGMRTPRKKSVVYISYTEHASQWVRSTLKPMIDLWDIADVMIPERDMVAGKAISNERRRLIVEADKVIVVISPDYYDSEWCSYELMHAIQNEPTLSRGRIIPILVDGCKLLPKNMEVVVPLFAHEQDFSQRLRAAIYPQLTPRLSLQ